MNRAIFAIILALSVAIGFAAYAEQGPVVANAPAEQDKQKFEQNLKKWQSMTPEQQERLRELYKKWQSMPEAERERIRENMSRFHKMQEARRDAILRARKMLDGMNPGARADIEKRLAEVQQMPPERRHLVMQKLFAMQGMLKDDYEKLRALPPDSPEARQLSMQMHWKSRILRMIPPEEFEKLKGLPLEERQQEVRKFIDEHREMLAPMPEGGGPPFGGHHPDGDGQHHRHHPPRPDAPTPDNAPTGARILPSPSGGG